MNKGNKILLILVILFVIYAIVAAYYRFFVSRDYQIMAEISCDPETESCFSYEDEETELYYYKLINKSAANVPVCNPNVDECEELFCEDEEEGCEIIYCDIENLEEDEVCDDIS